MSFLDEEEKEKEDTVVSDDALGEVLEAEPEDDDEADPLVAEEEESKWE